MTNRQLNTFKLYCEWLNSHNKESDFKYTPDNWDPSKNEWATVITVATYDTDWYRCEVYHIYDGDDGGGAALTVYFDRMFSDDPETPRIATQEFDTSLTIWLQDSKVVSHD